MSIYLSLHTNPYLQLLSVFRPHQSGGVLKRRPPQPRAIYLSIYLSISISSSDESLSLSLSLSLYVYLAKLTYKSLPVAARDIPAAWASTHTQTPTHAAPRGDIRYLSISLCLYLYLCILSYNCSLYSGRISVARYVSEYIYIYISISTYICI